MTPKTDEHRNDSDDNSDNQPPKPKTKAKSQPPEEILQGLTDQRLVDALRTVLTAAACLTRLRGQLKGDDETMKPMLRSKDLTQLRALERVVTDLEDMAVRQRKERQKLLQIRDSCAPPPTRTSDPDPWELGDELVEEEDYSQAEAW